jgi:hypothetical protein
MVDTNCEAILVLLGVHWSTLYHNPPELEEEGL